MRLSTEPPSPSAPRRAFTVTAFARVLAPTLAVSAASGAASAQTPPGATATASASATAGVRAVAAPQPAATATAQPTAIGHGAGPGTSGGFGSSGLGMPGSGGRMGSGTIGMGAIGTIGGQRMGGPRTPITLAVRARRPTVVGPLSPDIVRRVVLRNLMRLRYCFETRQSAAPTAVAAVTLQFGINAQGAVVSPSSHLGAPRPGAPPTPFEACANGALATMAFPTPDGGGAVQVTYPIYFGPPDFVLPPEDGAAPASPPAPTSPPPPSAPPPGPVPVAPST